MTGALPAPFPPLVSGGGGLDSYPCEPRALTDRMAALYGVGRDQALAVRGVTHGAELIYRLAMREGYVVEAPSDEPFASIASLYGAARPTDRGVVTILRASATLDAIQERLAEPSRALVVVDEGAIEYLSATSAVSLIDEHPRLIVLRSLSLSHGLTGARIGAALAQAETVKRLAAMLEPHALPAPCVRLALQALDPSRMAETTERVAMVRTEVARLVDRLAPVAEGGAGPFLTLRAPDPEAVCADLARYGIAFQRDGDDVRTTVTARADVNDRILFAVGVEPPRGGATRTATVVRDTHETRIACTVDLDAAAPVRIATGVGFFDHMLEQVAAHGGFSLRLSCEGDLHTDPHHTVEDCAIVLGQALRQALGQRTGIARYGFVLPMDEAQASIVLDLSGRPCVVFDGAFDTPYIGAYRTDLTAHVFRSLGEHLGAAIHVSVKGRDDHHKTEAVFKAFGRVLRQAVRIEGDAVPSTKGVL